MPVMGVGGETKDQGGGADNAQDGAKRMIDLKECLQDAPSFRLARLLSDYLTI